MEPLNANDIDYMFSPKELAARWNLSAESIRRLFEREPGTIIFRFQRTGKRIYRSMRIPGAIAIRVQQQMTVAGTPPVDRCVGRRQ